MKTCYNSLICHIDNAIVNEIRKNYDYDELKIERDLNILRDWLKKQTHLPQNMSDDFIERFLLMNKFRIEQTKDRIEKYFTIRGLHTKTFRHLEYSRPSQQPMIVTALPTLNPRYERIVIIKMNECIKDDEDLDDVMKTFKGIMLTTEILFRNDYCEGYRIIHDFGGLNFGHFRKYANRMAQYGAMYQESYCCRVAAIEYINLPPFLDLMMQAGRLLMKPKIFKRITFHKSLESLQNSIGKDYLPKDYGGLQPTIQDILKIWDEEFVKNETFLEMVQDEISDESKRVGDIKFNEFFGANGTFKTLNLD